MKRLLSFAVALGLLGGAAAAPFVPPAQYTGTPTQNQYWLFNGTLGVWTNANLFSWNQQSAAYLTTIADTEQGILHPASDANTRTFTIAANASVPYPVGTRLTFLNLTSQAVTVAIAGGDTLTLANSVTTGSQSLAQNTIGRAYKVASTAWVIEVTTAGGGGGGTPANPTASVGLTAVNGSATTYMRSDAAPAISQAIIPTWTGLHTFSPTGTKSSGVDYGQVVAPTYNQTGTAGSTDLFLDPTLTALGSGSGFFIEAKVGSGADVFTLDRSGDIVTTGNLTVNNFTWSTASGPLFTLGSTSVTAASTVTTLPGVTSINGNGVPSASDTVTLLAAVQTLSNKRITSRIATLTDAATVTPATDSYDGGNLLTLSQTTTIANPTGTPTDQQQYVIRIKSTTAETLSFGTQYRGGTTALPTATTGSSKTDYLGFIWNAADSKWDYCGTSFGH